MNEYTPINKLKKEKSKLMKEYKKQGYETTKGTINSINKYINRCMMLEYKKQGYIK